MSLVNVWIFLTFWNPFVICSTNGTTKLGVACRQSLSSIDVWRLLLKVGSCNYSVETRDNQSFWGCSIRGTILFSIFLQTNIDHRQCCRSWCLFLYFLSDQISSKNDVVRELFVNIQFRCCYYRAIFLVNHLWIQSWALFYCAHSDTSFINPELSLCPFTIGREPSCVLIVSLYPGHWPIHL